MSFGLNFIPFQSLTAFCVKAKLSILGIKSLDNKDEDECVCPLLPPVMAVTRFLLEYQHSPRQKTYLLLSKACAC